MTDRDEDVLRRSLDAVDRHRTRMLIGIPVAVVIHVTVMTTRVLRAIEIASKK